MFKSPGHIAFSIGALDVHYYGIIMALSILAGILCILFIRNKYYKNISADTIYDLSFQLIIFGILGARLYYVLLDYKYFINNLTEIPAIWHGGLSIQGAILGGLIGGVIFVKKHNLKFFELADLYSFGLILGQAIGRWGNFFNSEAFGLPTQLPWKLYIPFHLRPLEYQNYEYFHPAFLYESLLNFFTFLILIIILTSKKDLKPGNIFCIYIILYSVSRILIETIRTDSVLNVGIFHIAHIACAVFIIFAIILLCYINIIQKN